MVEVTIDADDSRDEIGVASRCLHDNVPAPRLACEHHGPVEGRLDNCGEIGGQRGELKIALDTGRAPVASLVDGHRVVAGGKEAFCNAVPQPGVGSEAMHEHERDAIRPGEARDRCK